MDQSVFFDMTYGMFVIATKNGEKMTGCVVNTVSQLTANPSQISVSVNKDNFTTGCIEKTNFFTVSILTEDTKQDVIGLFGFQSGASVDKFGAVAYDTVGENMPVLKDGVCGWMLCKVMNQVDVGTHILFIAEVVDGSRLGGAEPMSYSYYHKVIKGKAPKNAPTYVEEKTEAKAAVEHVCQICGYVYDGSEGSFEELGEDFICPICGVEKSNFS